MLSPDIEFPAAALFGRCPRCGSALRADVASGLCPKCLHAAAFGAAFVANPPPMLKGLAVDAIDDYQILGEIARGGMGVVYRARQKSLGREVALKLLREGAAADGTGADRFRAEAEAAASLQHPNIVAIYGFGEYDGQPFFSMELIVGSDLAELTRAGPMPARRAATLVAAVARAVQHAHDRGILHRDLKPSNVVVDLNDEPHVTDFGLARRMGAESHLTLTGQVLGTPGYMAPEQAFGRAAEIGREADVYSLGALLYHLITGRAPFIGESPTRVLQQLEHAEPVTPRVLNSAVPQDLETVALKALSKEPHRRYQSAQAVADDLERFLRHEPIQARPLSPAERLVRWGRRRPAWAALSVLGFVFLVTLIGGTLLSNRRLEAQRRAAEQVKNFLKDILASPDPSRDGRDVRVVDLLQRAAHRSSQELADQPLVRAEIEYTLGATYYQLSLYPEGEPLLRSALAVYEKHLGIHDWHAAEVRAELGSLLHWSGRSPEGISLLQQSAATFRRISPLQDLRWAGVLEDLGSALVGGGRLADSIPILRECLALCDRLGTEANSARVAAYGDLATALSDDPSKRDEYLHYLGEAIALNRKMPDGKVNLATGLCNLADELILSERLDEAETAAREALALRVSLFGTNSAETAFSHARLASVYYAQTNLAAARAEAELGDRFERVGLPSLHRDRAFTLRIEGSVELDAGNVEIAEARFREAREVSVAAYGNEHPVTRAIGGYLAEVLARRGAINEARSFAASALPGLQKNVGLYPNNSKLRARLLRLTELAAAPPDSLF